MNMRDAPMRSSETQAQNMFQLDALYEGLTSGRLCGQTFDTETAQLMLVLLERLDWIPDARQLAGALPHFPDNFGIDQFRSTLATLGFLSVAVKMTGGQLATCSRATLVGGEHLWLLGQEDNKSHLVRPLEYGEDISGISKNKTYVVVQFEHRSSRLDGIASQQSSWIADTIHRFVPELRLLLFLTFLSGLFAILIALGITTIFDTVIPTRNYATLTGIIAGLGLIFVFDFKFRRIRADVVGRVSGRLEYVLGSALLGKLLYLPSAMLTSVSLSDQLSRLRQFESIRDLFGGPVVLLLLELPMALLLLVTVGLIAWPLAVLLAVYITVFTILTVLLAPSIRRETRKQGAAHANLNRVVLEALGQREQIGREGLAPVWVDKIDANARDLGRARRRLTSLTRWLEALSHASLPIAAGSVIGLGAILVMAETLTGGALVAATILTWRLFAPVQQGLLLLQKLQDVLRLFQQIDAMMRLPNEENGSEQGHNVRRKGNLSVRSVVLRHPKSITPVLMGVQFDIAHGTFVTVSGRSGAGKTTLLKVLAGQLQPQAGAVLFNELNLSQLSRGFRARNIAYVSQKPLFIYGSVAQNLRLADPSADDERLLGIINEMGLGPWLEGLPNGLETRLDPSLDGALLSASVLNSLSVAQALLTDPVVLLVDETAGNMDAKLEACFVQALEARRGLMTSVVVTHRPSLIKRSDKVIVLNAGSAVLHDTTDMQRQAS